MPDVQALIQKAPSIKHQPGSKRYYFDVALGSVCLTGADTGGALPPGGESRAGRRCASPHPHARR